MQTQRERLATLILLLFSIVLMGCSLDSGLFTEEELDDMYQIVVSNDGSTLVSGSPVTTATSLGLSIVGIDGAPEATSVELSLSYPDGTLAANMLFSTTETESSDVVVVKDFEQDVPPFTIPEDLTDGYYILMLQIRNAAGGILSKYSTAVLLYDGIIPAPSLAVYPGSVIAGEIALIRLEADFPVSIDPWVRWSVDGRVVSTGLNSNHADLVTWQAPAKSGVYLAKAEIYPFMPPPDFGIAPLSTTEIRIPVSADVQEPTSITASGVWSRLTFDGNLDDKGLREYTEELLALGSPIIETYESGFGYLLGNGAGVISTSSLLPVDKSSAKLTPFTALFVLAQAPLDEGKGSGTLLSVPATDRFPGLVIGVEKGFPYVTSGTSTIQSNKELQANVSRLAVYVAPTQEETFVQFYLDEQPSGTGTLTSNLFESRPGAGTISGPDGYSAIFDEFLILNGSYPAFFLSEQAAKGKTLICASGFEGGLLGAGFSTEGETAELSHGRLTLLNGSSLAIGPEGIPPQGTSLSFKLLEGKVQASIELADGKSLNIDTDGSIWLDGEVTGFRVAKDTPSILDIAIEPTESGLLIYSSDDSWVLLNNSAVAIDATWKISPVNEERAVISDVSLSILKSTLASSRRLRLISADSKHSNTYTAISTIKNFQVEPAIKSQILSAVNQ